MAAIAGIMNQGITAAQALMGSGATPTAAASAAPNATSGKSGATTSAATISSTDFLTLLVTELKNQDPTANTDPNQYINQLVNVNSLQQLISINQTLTNDLGSSTATTKAAPVSRVTSSQSANTPTQAATTATMIPGAIPNSIPNAISAAAAQLSPGNLTIPSVNSAARTVATSLSGR